MANRYIPFPARFWLLVERGAGCWMWRGTVNHQGYGRYASTPGPGSKYQFAHRLAWMLLRGAIPPDLTIDHRCKVRRCVNPDHMELVPATVNVKRGGNTIKTHCAHGHPYSAENTRYYKGKRYCVTCSRSWAKRKQYLCHGRPGKTLVETAPATAVAQQEDGT